LRWIKTDVQTDNCRLCWEWRLHRHDASPKGPDRGAGLV